MSSNLTEILGFIGTLIIIGFYGSVKGAFPLEDLTWVSHRYLHQPLFWDTRRSKIASRPHTEWAENILLELLLKSGCHGSGFRAWHDDANGGRFKSLWKHVASLLFYPSYTNKSNIWWSKRLPEVWHGDAWTTYCKEILSRSLFNDLGPENKTTCKKIIMQCKRQRVRASLRTLRLLMTFMIDLASAQSSKLRLFQSTSFMLDQSTNSINSIEFTKERTSTACLQNTTSHFLT